MSHFEQVCCLDTKYIAWYFANSCVFFFEYDNMDDSNTKYQVFILIEIFFYYIKLLTSQIYFLNYRKCKQKLNLSCYIYVLILI